MLAVFAGEDVPFNLKYAPLEPALPVIVNPVHHAGVGMRGLIWSFAVRALGGRPSCAAIGSWPVQIGGSLVA